MTSYVCTIIFLKVPTWIFKLFTFFRFDEHLYSQMFIHFLYYFSKTDCKKQNYRVESLNTLKAFSTYCWRAERLLIVAYSFFSPMPQFCFCCFNQIYIFGIILYVQFYILLLWPNKSIFFTLLCTMCKSMNSHMIMFGYNYGLFKHYWNLVFSQYSALYIMWLFVY